AAEGGEVGHVRCLLVREAPWPWGGWGAFWRFSEGEGDAGGYVPLARRLVLGGRTRPGERVIDRSGDHRVRGVLVGHVADLAECRGETFGLADRGRGSLRQRRALADRDALGLAGREVAAGFDRPGEPCRVGVYCRVDLLADVTDDAAQRGGPPERVGSKRLRRARLREALRFGGDEIHVLDGVESIQVDHDWPR